MLLGAIADCTPWDEAEDEILRSSYSTGGIKAAVAALPARSESSLYHRAKRLGLSRRARWTARDFFDLRELWAEGLSLATIAGRLGRTKATVYWHAAQIGLTSDVPPGFTRLSAAAAETGYTTSQLERILTWAGKRIRVVAARPGPRKGAHRYRMVDWISLHDALEAWHRTETPNAAAKRLGISADRLRARLRMVGVETSKRRHARVTEEQIAAANELAKWNRRSGASKGRAA